MYSQRHSTCAAAAKRPRLGNASVDASVTAGVKSVCGVVVADRLWLTGRDQNVADVADQDVADVADQADRDVADRDVAVEQRVGPGQHAQGHPLCLSL